MHSAAAAAAAFTEVRASPASQHCKGMLKTPSLFSQCFDSHLPGGHNPNISKRNGTKSRTETWNYAEMPSYKVYKISSHDCFGLDLS